MKTHQRCFWATAVAVAGGSWIAASAPAGVEAAKAPVAGPAGVEAAAEEPSVFDRIWEMPVLYDNPDAPFIKRFALIGRYQGQYHYTDANTGEDDGWENRRWRAGVAIDFFGDLSFSTNLNLARDSDLSGRFFEDIEDMTLTWKPGEVYSVSVGKQKARIGNEWYTSSTRILTFERSVPVSLIAPDKVWGVNVAGDYGDFDWQAGVFLGGFQEDWLWPDFDSGVGLAASVGYQVAESTALRFDYFYNDGDEANSGFRPAEHAFAVESTSKWDRFGLITNLLFGTDNFRGEDLFGLVVMPTYDINKKLKVVTRYQFATSSGNDGVRLPSRYSTPAVEDGSSTVGDDYHAVYAGLNWYIYGDKLKVMNGVEWSRMGGDADFEGWTFLTGVRMYF